MSTTETAGVILRTADYGESDLIVTLYTADTGLLRAIAKGAKRSRKRFVNRLERFSHIVCRCNHKYNLPLLEQAELIDSHLRLRHDYRAYTGADLACETARAWATEGAGDPELFAALLWILSRLDTGSRVRPSLAVFLARLHAIVGYRPNLSACSACGRPAASASSYSFSPAHGTMVCRACRPEVSVLPLSAGSVRIMDSAVDMPLEKLARLRVSEAAAGEILAALKRYGRVLLDRDLPSWEFLE